VYLITVDYLYGFFEVDRVPSKRISDIVYVLKQHFARHGHPVELISDNSLFIMVGRRTRERENDSRRPSTVSQTVRVKYDNLSPEWHKAEVSKVLPHRSCEVNFDDGSTRHVRVSMEPPIVLNDEMDYQPPAAAAAA